MSIPKLQAWAEELVFPAFIHCYGPERTHRTTYRGENRSGYGHCLCRSVEEVINLVYGVGFSMPLAEIEVSATYLAKGQLTNRRFARGVDQGAVTASSDQEGLRVTGLPASWGISFE
jgi:hypothetical protein